MTGDEKPPMRNKGGRPRKEPTKGRRGNYSFRMSDFTRDQLSGKAHEAGRSISEEVEYRVEQSLQKDGRLNAVLTMIGGADKVMFAALVGGDLQIAIDEANAKIGGALPWYDSPEKMEIVRHHMRDVATRSVDSFARMVQSGVALRTGQHMSKLAE